jgi:hypothetical protein
VDNCTEVVVFGFLCFMLGFLCFLLGVALGFKLLGGEHGQDTGGEREQG